jgi:TPR repeat protein
MPKIIGFLSAVVLLVVLLFYLSIKNKEEVGGVQRYALSHNELELLTESAENGNADAAYKLYGYYEFVENDYRVSIKWLTVSAQLGNAKAQYNLGVHFMYDDEDKNPAKGTYWLKKAAENGDAAAIALLKEIK